MKARGFVERSGMVICGGLPGAEMAILNTADHRSPAPSRHSSSPGRTRAAVDRRRRPRKREPPGRGQIPDQGRRPARDPGPRRD